MPGWNTPLDEEEDYGVKVVLGRDVPYPPLDLDYPEQPCPHTVVNSAGRCANCGVFLTIEEIPAQHRAGFPTLEEEVPTPRQAQGLSDPGSIRRRYLDVAVELAEEILGLIDRSLDHLDVYDSNAPGDQLDVALSNAAANYLVRLKEYQGRAERLEE